jgi:hypothetical protein
MITSEERRVAKRRIIDRPHLFSTLAFYSIYVFNLIEDMQLIARRQFLQKWSKTSNRRQNTDEKIPMSSVRVRRLWCLGPGELRRILRLRVYRRLWRIQNPELFIRRRTVCIQISVRWKVSILRTSASENRRLRMSDNLYGSCIFCGRPCLGTNYEGRLYSQERRKTNKHWKIFLQRINLGGKEHSDLYIP